MGIIDRIYVDGVSTRKRLVYKCVCDNCGGLFNKIKFNKGVVKIFCSRICSTKYFNKNGRPKSLAKSPKFIEHAKIKHNNFYSYDKVIYFNKTTAVDIICPIHGVFQQTAKYHLKYGCAACSGRKKFTNDEVLLKFKEKHGNKFDYSKFQYYSMGELSFIICPEHGEFEQTPHHHLISKTGCRACSGLAPWTDAEAELELLKQNRTIKLNGNCKGARSPTPWKCIKCEYEWSAAISEVLLHDKTGCPKCAGHMRLSNEIVDQRLKDFNDGRDIRRIGNFINSDERLEWCCNICSYQWRSVPHTLFGKGFGCPSCSGNIPLTNEIIDERLISENKNIKRLGECVNNKTKIEWQCLLCNHKWKTVPKVIFNVGCGCPVCNASGINEKLVKSIFDKSNLNFIYQKNLSELGEISNNAYRFDFYFPDIKTAIEYNGTQHYRPVKFGGMEMDKAEVNYQKQINRDKIIREFCKNNNIRLIEIDGRKYQQKRLIKYLELEILGELKGN